MKAKKANENRNFECQSDESNERQWQPGNNGMKIYSRSNALVLLSEILSPHKIVFFSFEAA